MVLLGEVAQVKLGSVHLEIVLLLMQNRWTVYMERTICLKINLDAPDGTHVFHIESRFGPFGDSVSFGAR